MGGSGGAYGRLLGNLMLVVVVGDGVLAAWRHGEVGGSVRQLLDGLRSGRRSRREVGTCTNVCAARAMASVEAASVARTRCLALSASLLLSVMATPLVELATPSMTNMSVLLSSVAGTMM